MTPDASLTWLLGGVMILYVGVMFAVSYAAQRRVTDVEDYVVAGRRLSLPLATATLLATWFGAGTLLTATDEVRERGVEAATLDPVGAGICLLLVGLFFARPLWELRLTTLPDLFRLRFSRRAEVLASALMIPPYLGWIAAQFTALAGMLELFFGLPLPWGVALVGAVGLGYTLMGGMWAVTLTDAIQMALVIAGLLVMGWVALDALAPAEGPAAGWARLLTETPTPRLTLIPVESLPRLIGWVGVLCAGALGNIPSQDVMQRVFSARSAEVARWACLIAGGLYLTLGAVPVVLGLAASLLAPPGQEVATLPLLAHLLLHPVMAVIFVLTLMSAVLSTIDSAILAPATVLAQNILRYTPASRLGALPLNRVAVAGVAAASLGTAYLGEDAYSLLESGYELGMVSLMAPLALGLWLKRRDEVAILASMVSGTALWTLHQALGLESFAGVEAAELPVGLLCTAVSFAAYPLAATLNGLRGRAPAP